jgi:dTDP-glucose 4,6-dehydratase
MKILVTGGAGFIGTSLVRRLLADGEEVVTLDKLTYAGATPVADGARHTLEIADIADREAVARVFARHPPDAVMHLAAETHVDRSIDAPEAFVSTNLVGTFRLLEAARRHRDGLRGPARESFRFLHVSTDEVFGSIAEGRAGEGAPFRPNSPYAASKAGADHLVRAWGETYGLPVIATNCTNNYGPWQFPEKLVPLTILNALDGKRLPVYGSGANRRDWLYVADHAAALTLVLRQGAVGATYNIAGGEERANLDLVRLLCAILDDELPHSPYRPHERLVEHVTDRPGHDLRYALDDAKIRTLLGWRPMETLEGGLRATVRWYLDNRPWWEPIRNRVYRGERLGLRV